MSVNASDVMTLEALRSVPLFASLDDENARALRQLLHARVLPAGAQLFRAGDAGDAMYLIESGRIRIHICDTDGHGLTLAELARGDFFGEMALLDGKPRSAAATVIEEARLAILPRREFLNFVRGNTDIALGMLSAIADRLRRTDELLRRRVTRNANHEEEARLTLADRMADMIAEFGGSWKFIFTALGLIVLWIILNSPLMRGGVFDPFPYDLLNLLLGIGIGMQAPIIMMSQNRQAAKDRLRADLDYQVNLKNELALTEVLRRLDLLESERLPLLFSEQNARFAASVSRSQDRGS